jgi:hypothetical protein
LSRKTGGQQAMTHQDSVRDIASILRASNEARPIFLLGAGASYSSGVPLASESVHRMARRVYAEKVKGGSLIPEQIKLTEWGPWLQGHPWFIKGDDRLAENFPLVVEHLLKPREYRARILRNLFKPTTGVGVGYTHLAALVMKGLVRTILTTNFDTALPIALNERSPHIPHVAEVNRNPDDLNEFSINSRAQLIWLHGKAEQYSDRNLAGEVEKLDRRLVDLLIPMLADAPLVVAGYRGAEPSIMDHLLAKNFKRTHNFRNGIYWCVRTGETLHPNVEALRRAIGGNFKLLEITGFDELMVDLAHELSGEDLYPNAVKAEESKRELAFDDRPLSGSSIDEIDHDQMLTVMRDYCQKLGRAPVTRETLLGLLREQGFLIYVDGTEIPTAGCMLLFGKSPQKYFPHAVVSATISGKKRALFTGNLLRQRVELLEWLSGEDINPLLKVKRGSKHEKVSAYPARGLVELLVNMLVHRDYQSGETASIDIAPGHSITFRNPGGLLDSVARRVELDEGGRFRAVPNVSDLRNRSLCDVFFGIQAMEREGTGLSDVETLAREHGGDASFTHDAKSAAFIASILQPVASIGSKTTARNDQPTGTYVLNVLPFLSLPETLSIVRLTTPISKRPAGVPLADAGTFIIRGEEMELWSFVPLPILTGLLGPIVDRAASREEPRSKIEADPDQRRVLSWLLRKHFEQHLARFQAVGLILEESRKKKRAYFEGREGKPRKLIYDTPRRKGIGREVVKQRGEAPRAWFENEGFGYEVTQMDAVWTIRIKPFYMFTGRDAKKPLPAFARTSRSTRRIKLDRNKNVEDDLTFWARFLSGGGPTINIGQDHVVDLIVEGQFLTIEVAEQGLLRESNEGEDRVLA